MTLKNYKSLYSIFGYLKITFFAPFSISVHRITTSTAQPRYRMMNIYIEINDYRHGIPTYKDGQVQEI